MEALEAIKLLRSSNDKWTLGLTLDFLAYSAVLTGDSDTAIAAVEEALALAEELDDKLIMASALNASSRIEAFINKDFAKAFEANEKASELIKEHGNRWNYAMTLYAFGNLAINLKQFELARAKLTLALQTFQELGSNRNVSMAKSDLAHLLRYEGKFPEAMLAYRETIREWQQMGHRPAVAHQLESIAFIAKALEQVEISTQLLGAAERLREIIEINMTAQERIEYDKEVADLKANMDEKEFTSLWAEGKSMTMEQAIEFALGLS
jgi:tetratricopeptide (TPR) repeat protein